MLPRAVTRVGLLATFDSPIPESCSPVAGIIRDIYPLTKATLSMRKRKPEAAETLTSSPYKKKHWLRKKVFVKVSNVHNPSNGNPRIAEKEQIFWPQKETNCKARQAKGKYRGC